MSEVLSAIPPFSKTRGKWQTGWEKGRIMSPKKSQVSSKEHNSQKRRSIRYQALKLFFFFLTWCRAETLAADELWGVKGDGKCIRSNHLACSRNRRFRRNPVRSTGTFDFAPGSRRSHVTSFFLLSSFWRPSSLQPTFFQQSFWWIIFLQLKSLPLSWKVS